MNQYVRTMNGYTVNKNPLALTILCVIDFSESSRHALLWATEMAVALSAHVIVLYTFRLLQSKSSEALQTKKRMEEQAVADFERMEKEVLAKGGCSYEFRTEVGFVTDRVEDHLRKNSIHLLVAGKKISLDNKETFDELMAQIEIPLVIVP